MDERKIIHVDFINKTLEQESTEPLSPEVRKMGAILQRINDINKFLKTAKYNKGKYNAEKEKLQGIPQDELGALIIKKEPDEWHLWPGYLKALIDSYDAEGLAERMRAALKKESSRNQKPED